MIAGVSIGQNYLISIGVTTRQRTERAYRDLLAVLRDCQQKELLTDCHLQIEIESVHAALMTALPEDSTSQADISDQFE